MKKSASVQNVHFADVQEAYSLNLYTEIRRHFQTKSKGNGKDGKSMRRQIKYAFQIAQCAQCCHEWTEALSNSTSVQSVQNGSLIYIK